MSLSAMVWPQFLVKSFKLCGHILETVAIDY